MKKLATVLSAALVAALVLLLSKPEPEAARPGVRMPARRATAPAVSVAAPPPAAARPEVRTPVAVATRENRAAERRLPSVDDVIATDVAKIAAPLGLDARTTAEIEALTRRSFADLMAEIEARSRNPGAAAENTDELLARRTAELHAKIQELLPEGQRARYREVVGLR